MHPKHFENVMAMSGPERAEYTIKKIADREELWSLYSDGWASSALDDNETLIFPIWPEPEFAAECARDAWSGYQPRRIDLYEFFDKFLNSFTAEGTLVGVFSHPSGNNVQMTSDEFRGFLDQELELLS